MTCKPMLQSKWAPPPTLPKRVGLPQRFVSQDVTHKNCKEVRSACDKRFEMTSLHRAPYFSSSPAIPSSDARPKSAGVSRRSELTRRGSFRSPSRQGTERSKRRRLEPSSSAACRLERMPSGVGFGMTRKWSSFGIASRFRIAEPLEETVRRRLVGELCRSRIDAEKKELRATRRRTKQRLHHASHTRRREHATHRRMDRRENYATANTRLAVGESHNDTRSASIEMEDEEAQRGEEYQSLLRLLLESSGERDRWQRKGASSSGSSTLHSVSSHGIRRPPGAFFEKAHRFGSSTRAVFATDRDRRGCGCLAMPARLFTAYTRPPTNRRPRRDERDPDIGPGPGAYASRVDRRGGRNWQRKGSTGDPR